MPGAIHNAPDTNGLLYLVVSPFGKFPEFCCLCVTAAKLQFCDGEASLTAAFHSESRARGAAGGRPGLTFAMSLNLGGLLKRRAAASLAAFWLAVGLSLAGQAASAQTTGIVGLRQVAGAGDKNQSSGPIYAGAPWLDNSADRAELSFALSAPVHATSFVLAAPDRIVVELPQVVFGSTPDEVSRGNARHRHEPALKLGGLVSSYRFGLFAPGKSRIVIDIAGPARIVRAETVTGANGIHLIVALAKTDRAAFLAEARRDLQAAETDAPAAPISQAAAGSSALPVVVIDPGHGGIDSGAMVRGLVEKNIVFAFARELAGKLRDSGRYKVIMTRDSDVFVALGDRVKIARDAGASLFVSIHADTVSDAAEVSGATVYTCSEHASDAEAARTAEKENQSDAVAGVESKDDDNGVSDILFDLTRQETRTYSRVFARTLVNYWQVAARLNKNPERFAGFRVLKAPDVPSVLIELGYLSNSADGVALGSAKWRDATTGKVEAAIDAFFTAKGVLPEKDTATAQSGAPTDPLPTATLK
jgi:N-acetylmuramoyl-L-alanine amidase